MPATKKIYPEGFLFLGFYHKLLVVAAQKFKIAQLIVQIIQQPVHLKITAASLNIQIKQVLKFLFRIRAGFQLAEIQIIQRKLMQQMIQRTGLAASPKTR